MEVGELVTFKYKKSGGVFTGRILRIDDEKICISASCFPQNDYYAQKRYEERKGLWYLLDELEFLNE